MRAINHALTGAVIGFSIANPVIAAPLAFLSHFVLDSLPHFGDNKADQKVTLNSKQFEVWLFADFILCFCLVLVLFLLQPQNWPQAALCAFLAASPDLFSVPRYITVRFHKKHYEAKDFFNRFHKNIQWGERPWGLIIEVPWFAAMIFVLVRIT